jgi:hypothetical protein
MGASCCPNRTCVVNKLAASSAAIVFLRLIDLRMRLIRACSARIIVVLLNPICRAGALAAMR